MAVLGVPRVVLVSLCNWLGAARLPKAFRRAGFDVVTVSYPNLLLARSRHASRQLFLPEVDAAEPTLLALQGMLVAERPAIVVPTDESSVALLQALAAKLRRELPEGDPLLGLLRDSLGDFSKHGVLRKRRGLAHLASEIGVRAPAYAVVHDTSEALAFAARHGFPVVLKAEETIAGMGVSICRDGAELEAAVTRLALGSPRAFREGAVLQTYIAGPTAMRAVIAWRGHVLAGLSAIKVATHPGSTGPSAVVQFIEQAEMMKTAQSLVSALGFSGFASLDFIIDAANGAHLLELNARPTPICHLGEYLGLDLCSALRDAIEGKAALDRDPPNLPKQVALFPQAWVMDPSSRYLLDSFHDVPWDEPDLVETFISVARSQMRWDDWTRDEARRDGVRECLVPIDA